ncbi:MAG: hypothetical protein J1E95_11325, partial [Muribaculaceae bacterium]|nr:hypothetical protein [Muribaculaceae bacterium]
DVPMDAYTPYWLCTLAMNSEVAPNFLKVAEVMGDDLPPEGEYVYETLSNIDLNTIDVITFMYVATDYLMNHPMYSDEDSMDIQQFTGNLEASFEILQRHYPHLRIIVMSPIQRRISKLLLTIEPVMRLLQIIKENIFWQEMKSSLVRRKRLKLFGLR